MKTNIYITTAIVILGLPVFASGSSVVMSLIQGKTPAEAIEILAGQIDGLLSRVGTLENSQIITNSEIELLKQQNENLRLKNENLELEANRISQQVVDNEKSVDAVNQCIALEKTLVCAQTSIDYANARINVPDLSMMASLEEVLSALTPNTYYAKPQSDEICWKFNGWKEDLSQGEQCRPRQVYIESHNEDARNRRQDGQRVIEQGTNIIQSKQPKFEELQCEVLLKKYVPSRAVPGCA